MARPYTIQAEFQADFRKLESEANKFGNRFGKVLEQALEVGSNPKITASLEKYLSKQKAMTQRLTTTLAEYEYRVKFKTAQDVANEQQRLNQKIADAERDLAVANLNDKVKAQRKAEKEEAERQKKVLSKDDKQLEKRIKTLKNASKGYLSLINKAGKPAQNTIERIARGQKVSEEYAERFRKIMNASGEEFVETVEGGLERLSSSLRGSIDLGSMIKGGTGMLSKGLGGVGDMLSGIGAGGGEFAALATSLGAVATVAGALVGVFGVFAAVMVGVDKEVKEFNKSAINAFGARSVLAFATDGTLETGLRSFRHAVQDLTTNLGLTEQEAVGLFDTLDQGGFTLAKISKNVDNQIERERELQITMQNLVAASKAMGVAVNEFTNQATEMSQTYGESLDSIIGQFASISKMAQDAGFSTRRFYSLVVQATSSQAGLNVRIAETAEILSRMSKILGDKQAAGFLEQMGGSFASASSTDLMKVAAIAGVGDVREIAKKELRSQSRVFLGEAASGGKLEGLQAEAARVGITNVSIDNPEEFAQQLAGLETEDRNRLIASVTRMDSGLGRRLEDLTRISENVDGGLTELPEAMRTFSTGGVIRTYAEMAETFGVRLDDMNAIQRTAFANATGLSEEQITQMQRLARNGEGTFTELQELASTTTEISDEQKQEMIKQYGAYVENGKIFDANGVELVDAFDYLTTAQATGHLEDAEQVNAQMQLAREAYDETVTIGDILENKVVYYLRSLYENFAEPAIRWLGRTMGWGDTDTRSRALEIRNTLSREISAKQARVSEATRTVRRLEARPASELTPEQKTELETARRERDESRRFIERAQGTIRELSSGYYRSMEETTVRESVVRAPSVARGADGEGAAAAGAALASRPVTETRLRTADEMVARISAASSTTPAATPPARPAGGIPAPTTTPTPAPATATAPRTPAPTTTPTPPAASPAVAPTAAPVPAGGAGGAATARGERAAEDATSNVTDAIESSGNEGATATREAGEETRATMENEHEATRKHLTRVLTRDVRLGNALARSDLPQAIVDAQVRQQLMSLAFAAGMTDPTQIGATIEEYFTEGTFSNSLRDALSDEDLSTGSFLGGMASALGATVREGAAGAGLLGRRRLTGAAAAVAGASEESAAEDFVYRGDGVRGTITPIDERDTFVGMKPGGAIDRAVNGGGGSVTVNIYGGDERRVYDVVKRVLQQSGIGPSRVSARA